MFHTVFHPALMKMNCYCSYIHQSQHEFTNMPFVPYGSVYCLKWTYTIATSTVSIMLLQSRFFSFFVFYENFSLFALFSDMTSFKKLETLSDWPLTGRMMRFFRDCSVALFFSNQKQNHESLVWNALLSQCFFRRVHILSKFSCILVTHFWRPWWDSGTES